MWSLIFHWYFSIWAFLYGSPFRSTKWSYFVILSITCSIFQAREYSMVSYVWNLKPHIPAGCSSIYSETNGASYLHFQQTSHRVMLTWSRAPYCIKTWGMGTRWWWRGRAAITFYQGIQTTLRRRIITLARQWNERPDSRRLSHWRYVGYLLNDMITPSLEMRKLGNYFLYVDDGIQDERSNDGDMAYHFSMKFIKCAILRCLWWDINA